MEVPVGECVCEKKKENKREERDGQPKRVEIFVR